MIDASMIDPAIDLIINSPQILAGVVLTDLPQTAYDSTTRVMGVPNSAYDYANGFVGWDLGTTVAGAAMMTTAALTDVIPYLGNVDDPILYPVGALFLEQASQNRPINEAAEVIAFDKIGGAIRRIVPGADFVVKERTSDPMTYAAGGVVLGAVAAGALAIALKMTDVI